MTGRIIVPPYVPMGGHRLIDCHPSFGAGKRPLPGRCLARARGDGAVLRW